MPGLGRHPRLFNGWSGRGWPGYRRRASRFCPAMTTITFPYIAISKAIATALALAILRQFIEGLGKTFQGKRVRGLGALCRDALDHRVRSLAHHVHHPLFLGGIL